MSSRSRYSTLSEFIAVHDVIDKTTHEWIHDLSHIVCEYLYIVHDGTNGVPTPSVAFDWRDSRCAAFGFHTHDAVASNERRPLLLHSMLRSIVVGRVHKEDETCKPTEDEEDPGPNSPPTPWVRWQPLPAHPQPLVMFMKASDSLQTMVGRCEAYRTVCTEMKCAIETTDDRQQALTVFQTRMTHRERDLPRFAPRGTGMTTFMLDRVAYPPLPPTFVPDAMDLLFLDDAYELHGRTPQFFQLYKGHPQMCAVHCFTQPTDWPQLSAVKKVRLLLPTVVIIHPSILDDEKQRTTLHENFAIDLLMMERARQLQCCLVFYKRWCIPATSGCGAPQYDKTASSHTGAYLFFDLTKTLTYTHQQSE